jgi:quinol monooxygenase YgiN
MILIAGRATLRPDQRDAALSAADAMRTHTIAEPGCDDYRFWVGSDDPNTFLLFEQWDAQESLDRHLTTPELGAFLDAIAPALAGPLEVTRFEVARSGPLF